MLSMNHFYFNYPDPTPGFDDRLRVVAIYLILFIGLPCGNILAILVLYGLMYYVDVVPQRGTSHSQWTDRGNELLKAVGVQ